MQAAHTDQKMIAKLSLHSIRILSFGILILIASLSACAGIPTTTPSPAPATQVASSTPSPAPTTFPAIQATNTESAELETIRGTTVTLWHPLEGQEAQALAAILEQFNTTNEYQITVVERPYPGFEALSEGVENAAAPGELPDLVIAYNYQYLGWAAAGVPLVDLTSYLQHPGYGLDQTEIDDFYPALWAQDLIAEQRLGFPLPASAQVMLYNQTWAQELSFDTPPTTPEEFVQQACAAAEASEDGKNGWLLSTRNATLVGWLYAYGANFELPGAGYDFTTSQARAAFGFLHDLATDGCAWEPETSYANEEFANRQGLFYISSILGLPSQLRAFERAANPDQWVPIGFPSTTGQPLIPLYAPSLTMITSTPQKQLVAWMFIKVLSQAENQAIWVQSTGRLPTRASALLTLDEYAQQNPQWAGVATLLPYGRHEPRLASWGVVRGALSDAAKALFQPETARQQVPNLLNELDLLADELHALSGE